ncbi:MAG: hypothetical protein R6W91_07695, partial [Thermoplasmata archaeon]
FMAFTIVLTFVLSGTVFSASSAPQALGEVPVQSASDVDISLSGVSLSGDPVSGVPTTVSASILGDTAAPSEWVKRGIVLDIGGTGESLNILTPSVLRLPDGSYAMYYMGSALSGYNYRIFRAISTDGITWQKQGVVIDRGGAYAGACVYHPYIMLDSDGVYRMWYNGVNYEDGYRSRTLYAYSYDGINFIKVGLDMNFGSSCDPAGVHQPYVLNEDGSWRMWYTGTYWSPLYNRICHAHKTDLGNPWLKDGTVLSNDGTYDNLHALRPWVMATDEGGYEMFYTGIDTAGKGRILHATSPNGMSWTRNGVVLEPTMALEGTYIGYCSVIREGDTYRMWYGGYSGTNWRIFYAEYAPAVPASDASCTVSFYMDSVSPENLIGSVPNVFVPANGRANADIQWVPIAGGHDILAILSDISPGDIDEKNNIASTHVVVAETDAVDLSISSGDISVSSLEPSSGTPITVTATVHGDSTIWADTTQETLVFSDDFETGNLDKWVKTAWNPCGLLEVSGAISYSEPYSLHCQSYPGTNTGPYVLKYFSGSYEHVIIETKFYLPVKSQSIDKWDIIRTGSSTGTNIGSSNYEFYVQLRDDDYSIDLYEYFKDASGIWHYGCLAMDVYELSPQTWHDVSLEITPTEYIVAVGGTVVASGQRTASTPIHHLLLGDEGGAGGCWGDSYWDDVKVWSVAGSTEMSHEGLNATCTASFYMNSVAPENIIGSVPNIFVPADGQVPVSIEWVAVAGQHDIIVVISDVNPPDSDLSNNQASIPISVSSPAPITSAELAVEKVKLSGIDSGVTLRYYEWELLITVTNNGGSDADDVTVYDVLPAEFDLLDVIPSHGQTEVVKHGKIMGSTHITWQVGTLEPGRSETLYLKVCTLQNPAGKQEFTSPGTYIINEGAYAVGIDTFTGEEIISDPAQPITVDIMEYSDSDDEPPAEAEPGPPAGIGLRPTVIKPSEKYRNN